MQIRFTYSSHLFAELCFLAAQIRTIMGPQTNRGGGGGGGGVLNNSGEASHN